MKFILPIALTVCILSISSCKKAVKSQLDNIIISSMTDGQWVITSFKNNGADITSDFSGYKFQYHTDMTVEAIKDGTTELTGTWNGDALKKTTSASFPGNSQPVTLLNGTWKISNNTWTYVVASQTVGLITKSFRLEKE